MLTPLVAVLTAAVLPGFFEPNVGQFGEEVLFAARSTAGLVLFTETSAVDSNGVIFQLPRAKGTQFQLRSKATGTTNYTGAIFVPRYERLARMNVAPGIDAVYSVNDMGTVECEFIGREGADPAAIEIVYRGVDRVFVDSKGKLTVRTITGRNIEPMLRFSRIEGGRPVQVEIQPVVRPDGTVMLAEIPGHASLLRGRR